MQKRAVRNRALEAVAMAEKIPAQIMRPAVLAFPGNHLIRMKLFSACPAGSKPALFQSFRALLAFTIRRKAQHPAPRIKSPETPVPQFLPVVRVFQQSPRMNLRTSENCRRLMRCQKVVLHCLPCNEALPRPESKRIAHRFPFQRRSEPLQPKPPPAQIRVDPATGRDQSCRS